MKRTIKIAVLLCLAVVLMLTIASCKNPEEPEETTQDIEQTTQEHTHTFGMWTTVKEPTKNEEGEQQRSCACGEKETKAIPATGSVGLNYLVNEDGQTCEIIDIGTCEDTELYIPTVIDGYRVTKIASYAFAAYRDFTKVIIPDSVISIGLNAFSNSFTKF